MTQLASTNTRAIPSDHAVAARGVARSSSDVFAIAAIATVLCVSLILKLGFATGPVGSDDLSYFHGAKEILQQGSIPELHHHLGRKIFILLAGIPAALGGHIIYGAIANILYVELMDIAVAAFVYRQFGPMRALVATIITSLNGPELLWSGTLLPDMMVALFMFLSVVASYFALLPEDRFRFGLLAAAGALAGLGYAVKEPGILLLPPTALCILFRPGQVTLNKRIVSLAEYVLAFACAFAAEGLLQYWMSGDFFYREHAVAEVHNLTVPPVPLLEFIRNVYWSAASISTTYRETLLLPIVAGGIACAAVALKRSAISVFALTALFVGAYLTFGTTSFPELRPIPFQPRYLAPVFPLIAVCLAVVVPQSIFSRRETFLASSVFLLLFVAMAVVGTASEAGDLVRARFFKNAAAAAQLELAQNADVPIMVDPNTLDTLPQFMSRRDYLRLKPIPDGEDLPAGFYLVDPLSPVASIRPKLTPHLQEIMSLPVVATFNVNPLLISRYLPDFGSAALDENPSFIATLRRKEAGR